MNGEAVATNVRAVATNAQAVTTNVRAVATNAQAVTTNAQAKVFVSSSIHIVIQNSKSLNAVLSLQTRLHAPETSINSLLLQQLFVCSLLD